MGMFGKISGGSNISRSALAKVSNAGFLSRNTLTKVSTSGDTAYFPLDPPVPDAKNFKIIRTKQKGNKALLWVNYPNCTNYEGNKIILIRLKSGTTIKSIKTFDPHFIDDKHSRSFEVLARFRPTDEGWKMGIKSFGKSTKPKKLKTTRHRIGIKDRRR